MKRVLTTLVAAAALAAVAAPTLAQPYGGANTYRGDRGYDQGYNQFERRLDRLEERVERGIQSGQITRRESFRIRQDMRELQMLENRYSRGGFTRAEVQDLDRRLDILQQRIRFERRDDDQRYDRRDDRRYDRRAY